MHRFRLVVMKRGVDDKNDDDDANNKKKSTTPKLHADARP
jgi:hypothetical protein